MYPSACVYDVFCKISVHYGCFLYFLISLYELINSNSISFRWCEISGGSANRFLIPRTCPKLSQFICWVLNRGSANQFVDFWDPIVINPCFLQFPLNSNTYFSLKLTLFNPDLFQRYFLVCLLPLALDHFCLFWFGITCSHCGFRQH